MQSRQRSESTFKTLAIILLAATLLVAGVVAFLLLNPGAADFLAPGRGATPTATLAPTSVSPALPAGPKLPPSWTPEAAQPVPTILPGSTRQPPTPTLTTTPLPSITPTLTPSVTATPTGLGVAQRVLIISVDGLRPDAISPDRAPNMVALMNSGAYSLDAQTVFPPITLPAHTSMMSGVGPNRHGVNSNDYWATNGTVPVETAFLLARQHGERTVYLFGKAYLGALVLPGSLDLYLDLTGHTDTAIAGQAAPIIRGDFDLMLVHLPDVDLTGHATAWMSDAYLKAVTRADLGVGTMLDALDAAGFRDSTLVIVTADHGGHDDTHFADIPVDRTIPWIIAGAGVRPDGPLGVDVHIRDTAPTVLYALGVPVPGDWEGRVVLEAF